MLQHGGVEVGHSKTRTAIVTGAGGQDGFFLTRDLLREGFAVHAIVRDSKQREELLRLDDGGRLHLHAIDLVEAPESFFEILRATQPEEFYNLAGRSSVAESFEDPVRNWRMNASFVTQLLEELRFHSPETRLYQASSTEMYGPTTDLVNENSPFAPRSPYGAAKAAAHLLCRAYREGYGLRIACGILSNHESARRGPAFLTSKILNHVRRLIQTEQTPPLRVGNLKAVRDWGYAPDFVEGMRLILRQVEVRSRHLGTTEADVASSYRDYILATGKRLAVWELIDRAFRHAGQDLEWFLGSSVPADWHAVRTNSRELAVIVDPALLRPDDPPAVSADGSPARCDLGWLPRHDIETLFGEVLYARNTAV